MPKNNEHGGRSKDLPNGGEMTSQELKLANSAATVQARFLHGMVPVLDNLDQLDMKLSVVVMGFECWIKRGTDAAKIGAWLTQLASQAHSAAEQLRHEADLAGFPIEAALTQYRNARASLITADQMRNLAATDGGADWDQWTNELQGKKEDDE